MKYLIISCIICTLSCSAAEITEEDIHDDYSLLDGIGRGFANITCGIIELPRCMTYYAVEYPVVGLVAGTLQGGGMSLYRIASGVVDVATIGSLTPGNTMYDLMDEPLYPWESPWLPPKDEYTWPPSDTTVPTPSE